MGTVIRGATAADVGQILAFVRALAAFEREPDAVVATEEGLLRDGFGPNPFYTCLMADHDGQPAGFALFFYNYSTWLGRPGVYLEDLFVLPEFRGRGIGRALLERVAAIAIEKGCERLQWEVLDWNTPAIDFYRAMGAEFLDEWRNVRLNGEAIRRLAGKTEDSRLPPISAQPPHEPEPVRGGPGRAEMDGARGDFTRPPFRQNAGDPESRKSMGRGDCGDGERECSPTLSQKARKDGAPRPEKEREKNRTEAAS
jgi:GNAT superfamily N-acetyltransferase